jgi:two-component system cell cycle response regulator
VQASLLIVDSIATNRVALKVKLSSAWYEVNTASTGEDAFAAIDDTLPNLVIVNTPLPDMTPASFCMQLKARMGQSAPPILALSGEPGAREPLLRSGVEDVLPFPVDDRLLIARIRSILRYSASESEWRLRDGTTRALGFAEPVQAFDRPVTVMHLRDPDARDGNTLFGLVQEPGLKVVTMSIEVALRNIDETAQASVLVLDLPDRNSDRWLSMLSDLRANARTRHKAILVIVPENRPDLAAQALDLGADEATLGIVPTAELALRARRLHRRREINDSLRAMVRNGAEAAIRDPLTGLYNRRYAMPHLERIAEQSRHSGRPYAVMIADLDHFKRINDWHGHEAGDAVLAECAQRMQSNMRAVDLVARIGGEEFLIVMPGTARAAARQAALRLCEKISQEPVALPGQAGTIDVTVSIGLALGSGVHADPASGIGLPDTPESLIKRADRALYRAKEMGRNRFMLERSAA